jgi:hypothetical protein
VRSSAAQSLSLGQFKSGSLLYAFLQGTLVAALVLGNSADSMPEFQKKVNSTDCSLNNLIVSILHT